MINYNGKIQPPNQVSLSVFNRGFAYGDTVFETLRLSSGKIFFWEDHYFRLMSSMRILRMEIPMNFTMEYLQKHILETAQQAHPESGAIRVKLTVFRNEGGFYTPQNNTVSFIISAQPLDADFYMLHQNTCEIELFKDHFILSGLLSSLKTNNKLPNILAGIYAKENGYDNCLLLNENKMVVEALNGNLFLVSGKTIKTPPLKDGCLRGVLRKQLIEIIKQLPQYTFEEASISPFELQKADELFITNVITGIQPVMKYRKKVFKNEVAKDLLTKLNVKIRLS